MTPSSSRREAPPLALDFTGDDLFVIFDGIKIAKRGQPGTEYAGRWIALEPGFTVLDGDGEMLVEQNGVPVH